MLKNNKSIKVSLLALMSFATSIGLNFSLFLQPTSASPKLGQCVDTHITNISSRLIDGITGEPVLNSGVSVYFNNGILLVSNNRIAEVLASQPQDQVKLCLQSVPQNCLTGDNRGKVYKVINYRTGKEFTLVNSLKSCLTPNFLETKLN